MPHGQPPPALDRTQAAAAVTAGAHTYFAQRRARVPPFVTAHFSLSGTLRLHRAALGWDILKAPINLSLGLPQILLHFAASIARTLGARTLAAKLHRNILLRTAVAAEIEWLIHTELLELPFSQLNRQSTRDALSDAILDQPEIRAAMQAALHEIGAHGQDAQFRARLARALDSYGLSRAAAAEITTGLLNIGAGALAINKLTPGAATLGPALAGIMAHQTAVSAFPLGAWLGSAWYGFFPALPSAAMIATTTGTLMLTSATLAAFAGVIFDPIQRALGLHNRRLLRMIDSLERQFTDPQASAFAVRDHYIARLLDLFDIIGAALRVVRA